MTALQSPVQQLSFRGFGNVFLPFFFNFISGRLILQTDLIMVAHLSPDALAAFGIPMRIMIVDALIAFAVAPFVSVSIGRMKSSEDRREFLNQALSFAILAGVSSAAIGVLFYPWLIHRLGVSVPIGKMATQATLWLTVFTPVRLAQFVGAMALHGMGKGKWVVGLSFLELGLNAVLDGLLIFGFRLGFVGSYIGTVICACISLVLTLYFLHHELGGIRLGHWPSSSWLQLLRKNAAPELVRLLSERVLAIFVLALVAHLNRSSALLGVFSVATELQFLLFIPSLAAMRATAVLLAPFHERPLARLRQSMSTIQNRGIALSFLIGLLIALSGDEMGRENLPFEGDSPGLVEALCARYQLLAAAPLGDHPLQGGDSGKTKDANALDRRFVR